MELNILEIIYLVLINLINVYLNQIGYWNLKLNNDYEIKIIQTKYILINKFDYDLWFIDIYQIM